MRTTRSTRTAPARGGRLRGLRRRPSVVAVAVLTGLLGSGAFVWQSSQAAFTSVTTVGANSFSTGSVTLAADTASAIFSPTGLVPGSTGTACIKLTYSGSLTAAGIKLYVTSSTDSSSPTGLLAGINMTIEEGTLNGSGATGSCAGFSVNATLANAQSLSALAAANTQYSNGLGSSWLATNGQYRAYRFTYTVSSGLSNTLQGKTANVTFQWEAQSS